MSVRWLCFVGCGASVALHFFSGLDIELQKMFYFSDHWLVDPKDPVFYSIFYILPKIIVIGLGVVALGALLWDRFQNIPQLQHRKKEVIVFIICVATFPMFINFLKELLRQPCPRDLAVFGGEYSGALSAYLWERGPIRCFPGAHAAAPFSMLSLIYFFKDRYEKALFLLVIIPYASLVSMYQVVRGVHFLSDTLFTAFSAWLFAEAIYCLVSFFEKRHQLRAA